MSRLKSILENAEEEEVYICCCVLLVLGFRLVFGKIWAQECAEGPRREKRYINQRKLAREIVSKTPRTRKLKIWP